jgi:hypothetical protein
MHYLGSMELSEQKLHLIERLMRVTTSETLTRVEEILAQAELESRAEISLKAIKDHETVVSKSLNKKMSLG